MTNSVTLRGTGLVVLALAVSGCSLAKPISNGVYVPTLVGVVVDVESDGQDTRYSLADGHQFFYPRNGNFIGGSAPRTGTILIAGTEPVTWVSWAAIRDPSALTPEGCFAISGRATMDATHVFQTVTDARGDVVVAFPKSADWVDHGYEQGSTQLMGSYTCINPQGQAFERGR